MKIFQGKFIFIFITLSILLTFNACEKTAVQQDPTRPEVSVQHPDWSKNVTMYEVNVRQYTPEGTFEAFAEHLPKIKDMGFGILWFMPIHPIGELNRKGELGSYYAVQDYKAINPSFGTEEEFRALVKEAHDMGMYVIIDWVANHTAWDNVWTKTNPEFYTKDSVGNFKPPVADWSDVIELDFENQELWREMADAMKFWVEKFDIDGYRCDVAGEVPIDFWNYAREELDKIKPVFMLAEAEQKELHYNAFDATYAWEAHHIMNKIAANEMTVADWAEYWQKETIDYPQNAYRLMFTSNHDENSWNGTVFERMGDGAKTFAVMTFTVPGMPLVYSGQEVGMDKRLEFFKKDPIDWKESEFTEFYDKLIDLKLNNESLWNGAFGAPLQRVNTNFDDNIYSFIREKDGNKVFVILNLSGEDLSLKYNDKRIVGEYTELFTGDKANINSDLTMDIPAWGYKVYQK